MLKSDFLRNSDAFEVVAMDDFIWDNCKIATVIDTSLVISVDGFVTDGMF